MEESLSGEVFRVRQIFIDPIGFIRRRDDDLFDRGRAAAGFEQIPSAANVRFKCRTGLRLAMPTIVCAARWKNRLDFILADDTFQ
jgi:hypothetical protein